MPTLLDGIEAKSQAFFSKISSVMQSMTYRTKTVGGVDASTGLFVEASVTDYSFEGFPYQFTTYEQSSMKDFETGDLKVLMQNTDAFTPAQTGYVVWAGTEYNIIAANPDPFGVSWTLQLRDQK